MQSEGAGYPITQRGPSWSSHQNYYRYRRNNWTVRVKAKQGLILEPIVHPPPPQGIGRSSKQDRLMSLAIYYVRL